MTLATGYINQLDLAKRQNAARDILDVIEILAQMSPVYKMGYAEVCNDGTRHLTTMRTSIPAPSWVKYYDRITPTKSTTRQVTDTTGMLENMSDIDVRLYNRTKDKDKLRLQEAMGILEGFAQTVESAFFYGDTGTNPLGFLGLAPRMSSTTAENGGNVIKGAGSGSDNTSIFLHTWGPRTGMMLYPENTTAGVVRSDKGEVRSETSSGTLYYMEELFRQDVGYTQIDWRYHVRIANIDVSNLTTASADDLIDLLTKAYYRLPSRRSTTGFNMAGEPVTIKPVIYCNATIMEHLDRQTRTAPNRFLTTMQDAFGEEVLSFRGLPIYETDGIVNTETAVS